MNQNNNVVKFISDDDGMKIDHPVWHLIDPANPMGAASLCTGEFFGDGESSVEFKQKVGAITCPKCIEKIKIYHAVKL